MKIEVEILKKIDNRISRGCTGNPARWARELGMKPRAWFYILNYLKEELHAPIEYSIARQTYYYTEEFELYIGDLNRIKKELVHKLLETIDKTKLIVLVIYLF